MARVRDRTIGALHSDAGWLYGVYLFEHNTRRVRSALNHLCSHLEREGRLLGEPERVHAQIGKREFRDRQRVVLGTTRQTLSDIRRAACSAVYHDRIDLLAETVDWYGRTVHTAQSGLQGWFAAHTRRDVQRILNIAQDCGRPELGRSLLAFEAWSWRVRGVAVPKKIFEALAKEPADHSNGPYRVLAAALVKRSGMSVPAWAEGVEAWSHVEPATNSEPQADWPAKAWSWINQREGQITEITQALGQSEPTDWGRQLAIVLSHSSAMSLDGERAQRVGELLRESSFLDWFDSPAREAVTALGTELRDALLTVEFDLLSWWRSMLAQIRTDQQKALSSSSQHVLRLALNTHLATGTAELVLELARELPEPLLRSRVIREVPGLVGNILLNEHSGIAWAHRMLSALVELEASAISEVTSDNLMFGIGRAFGSRCDSDAVHRAFARIRSPWVRGQVLCVQRPDCIAALDIAGLPAQLTNPLAQRFALTHIFRQIGASCSTATLAAGIEITARCEQYPEVRVAGLEGVLSALADRTDHEHAMAVLWEHHEALLDVDDSYTWRIVDLLLGQGVEPESCPDGLADWIRKRIKEMRPAEKAALAAYSVGPKWPTDEHKVTLGYPSTGGGALRDMLLADEFNLDTVKCWTAEWSPEEWALWTNTLTIAEPEALEKISSKAAEFLIEILGFAEPSPPSVTALLTLLNRTLPANVDGWPRSHRLLVVIGRDPSRFSPQLAREFSSDGCWNAIMAWMAIGERSDYLVHHIQHPAVREWLDKQQRWIVRSEFGRLYPIVRHPNRALLSWLTLMGMEKVRPAQMLVAELLTRCAQTGELERLRKTWLSDDEGASDDHRF